MCFFRSLIKVLDHSVDFPRSHVPLLAGLTPLVPTAFEPLPPNLVGPDFRVT